MNFLSEEVVTMRSINATAAGTTAINGTGFDLSATSGQQGYGAVRGVVAMGALTATQVTAAKLQQSNDNGSSDAYADITGSATAAAADADSNKLLITDCVRPTKKWLRLVVTRGTANAVIDSGMLEVYRPLRVPVTQDGTVSQSVTVEGGN
jgi:hypothetical protein